MVCSMVASACRLDIMVSPRQNRAAQNRHQVIHVEGAPAFLAEAVVLHDAVLVLVAADLLNTSSLTRTAHFDTVCVRPSSSLVTGRLNVRLSRATGSTTM